MSRSSFGYGILFSSIIVIMIILMNNKQCQGLTIERCVTDDQFDFGKTNSIFEHSAELNDIVKKLLQREYNLQQQGIIDCHQLKSFIIGAWTASQGILSFQSQRSVVENNKIDFNPDHWFELNLANVMLFDNLSLKGLQEFLPGRLFSTRLPRNIGSNFDGPSAEAFRTKVVNNKLQTIVVLVEDSEFAKFNSEKLMQFYASLSLEVIRYPIVDFSIPSNQTVAVQLIGTIMHHLAQGRNTLIHCAGGTGRTGIILAGIIKTLGIQDPIQWIRRIKSTYVETAAQEKWVDELPPVLSRWMIQDESMAAELTKAISAEHLLQLVIRDKSLGPNWMPLIIVQNAIEGNNREVRATASDREWESLIPKQGKKLEFESLDSSSTSDDAINIVRTVYQLLDIDGSGTLTRDELRILYQSLGGDGVNTDILDRLVSAFEVNDSGIPTQMFLKMMLESSSRSNKNIA